MPEAPPIETVGDHRAEGSTRILVRRTLLASLLLAIAVTYFPVVVEWVKDWIRDSNYRHGFLIPVISGYILWRKREEIAAARPSSSWLGALALIASCALLVVGTAGAEVFTQRVSFLGVIASIVLFLWGWKRLGMTFFPIAFLFLAIPLPYVVYYGMTAPMQTFAAKCAIFGLNAIGVPSAIEGNVIHLPNTSLEVAEACSGIRSLYAFLALGALAAWSTSVAAWARVLIFLTALPLSVAGNAVRVWGTGIGAYIMGPEVAEGTVHELFGMITITGALIAFAILRSLIGRVWTSESPSSS